MRSLQEEQTTAEFLGVADTAFDSELSYRIDALHLGIECVTTLPPSFGRRLVLAWLRTQLHKAEAAI